MVAAVLLVGQLIGGGTASGSGLQPHPASATSSTATDDADDDDCATDECGNAHSRAIHAWVKCKAEKGKDACTKPTPPGHTKHAGKAPGPASADGHGNGWGRAHAPGQLKAKDKSADDDEDEDETP